MTWHTNTLYDTTYVEKERVDDPAGTPARWTITNMAKAANTTKPGVYNKTFSYVLTSASPSKSEMTIVGDRVEFFGERFNGHGNVTVFIDGEQKAVLYQGAAPWVTDFSRMQPSFGYTFPKKEYNSPPGSHTIRLETTAGNQYIIDFVRVVNYTLTPRIKPK